MACYQWTGLAISLVLAILCGIASSFNVYAVKLKTSFQLNQSHVELVASFVEVGWSFQIITACVIKRFGYQACYILVLFLTASTSLLMWVATLYATFFRENIWLMCLFQLLNTAGATGGYQCVSAIAAEHFTKKHTGKVIAVYMAALGLGKVYYSILFEIFFEQQETLGHFFLTVAISFTILVILCYCVHRQPTNEDSASSNVKRHSDSDELLQLQTVDVPGERQTEEGPIVKKSLLPILFTSSFFYLMAGSYVLNLAAAHTFVNNITGIGTSVGSKNPFNLVYITSVGSLISRLAFGALYDYFASLRNRFLLVFVQCLIFIFPMILCLFWLNGSTIYFVVVLFSVGYGAGCFLFLIMLVSEFGIPSYPIISGSMDVLYAPVVLISHLGAGWTYDHIAFRSQTRDLFCKECFYGTYVIVLSLATAVSLLQIVNYIVRMMGR